MSLPVVLQSQDGWDKKLASAEARSMSLPICRAGERGVSDTEPRKKSPPRGDRSTMSDDSIFPQGLLDRMNCTN
jgi:hypothetical protein